jgi:hypothetical protein
MWHIKPKSIFNEKMQVYYYYFFKQIIKKTVKVKAQEITFRMKTV